MNRTGLLSLLLVASLELSAFIRDILQRKAAAVPLLIKVAGNQRRPARHVPAARTERQRGRCGARRKAAADAERRAGCVERHERPDDAGHLRLLACRRRRDDQRPVEPAGADVLRRIPDHVHGAGTAAPWLPAPGVPRGAIARHAFHSAVANDDRDFFVYTPPGYDARRSQPYPVLYLLHGLGDDAERWMNGGGGAITFSTI